MANVTWNNVFSTPSLGYSKPVLIGNHLAAIKYPYQETPLSPLENLHYYLGRWVVEGTSLRDFKQIEIGNGKTQLRTYPVAVANRIYLMIHKLKAKVWKITAYDPETLTPTHTSSVTTNAWVAPSMYGAPNMLLLITNNVIQALRPDFSPLYKIELDSTRFLIPIPLVTRDSILFASCNGGVVTYDLNGHPTSAVQTFDPIRTNPFLFDIDPNRMGMGFYNHERRTSHFTIWSRNPLKRLEDSYIFEDTYLVSGVNTAEGVLLSGKQLLSLGSSHQLHVFEKYAYVEAINPSLILTVGDEVKLWKYNPPQEDSR